eukprot:184421-Rhodomonas_salina.2
MTFENDLWHLQVFADVASAGQTKSVPVAVTAVTSGTDLAPNGLCNTNRFSALAGVTDDPTFKAPKHCKKSGWQEKDIAEDHQAWCHPGPSKCAEIIAYYPTFFPRDPTTCKEIMEYRCPACDLCKGAREYCKTKKQKLKEERVRKQQQRSTKVAAQLAQSFSTEPTIADVEPVPGPSSRCP